MDGRCFFKNICVLFFDRLLFHSLFWTRSSLLVPGFNSLVLLGFTGFYRVLLGFTGFYWVLLEDQRLKRCEWRCGGVGVFAGVLLCRSIVFLFSFLCLFCEAPTQARHQPNKTRSTRSIQVQTRSNLVKPRQACSQLEGTGNTSSQQRKLGKTQSNPVTTQ